jgi:hypothetical protein
MIKFELESTTNTPKIQLDAEAQTALFEGKSYPENASGFYSPILQWFEEYLQQEQPSLNFTIQLVYFNSSCSKVLFDIFEMLEEAGSKGANLTVNWFYEKDNDSIKEYGEEFAEELQNISFHVLSMN